MTKDLDVAPKKRDRIEELERRIEYCERVARQYEEMYKQLERKIKTLADRQGNIQAVYDYMTQIGSSMVRAKSSEHKFLNPMNALEKQRVQIDHIEDESE